MGEHKRQGKTFCFRPLFGAYFFISKTTLLFPVTLSFRPLFGAYFFISIQEAEEVLEATSFRPLFGAYFFIL